MINVDSKVAAVCSNLVRQFNSRVTSRIKLDSQQSKAGIMTEVIDNTLWITFADHEGNKQSVTIPVPFMENGVVLLERDDTRRAVCPFFIKKTEQSLDFMDVINTILFGDAAGIVPDYLLKGVNFVTQLANAIHWNTLSITVRNLQRAINDVVNRMPLHKTYMNSWAMNRRLMIVDFDFEALRSPRERHDYQIQKNLDYFGRGWTSIGLSDGCLADKNYILTQDLRNTIPFGLKFHNPQRNLYSTLGMEGDELPLIRSQSMQTLLDQGITRTGWNLFTIFVDIPDVWEDQIMVDSSLLNKYVEHTKRYQVFGELMVKKGDKLKKGQKLAISPDKEPVIFKLITDSAWVDEINPVKVNVGGVQTEAFNIIVRYRRTFKDGMKITNLAANKGVMRVKDLGFAVDPRTGEQRKIEVMVSCRAVEKRKNYTQILEAIINNLYNETPIVFPDDIEVTKERLEERLVQAGFPKEGTWQCHTYAGELEAVAGKVFWGVTKDVEDQIWEEGDTTAKNGRGIREAGLKFSTVEFRALDTRLGKNNPVTDEIMSYVQGSEDLHEMFKILKCKRGELPSDMPVVELANVKPADTTTASIVPDSCVVGSVLDETYMPDGFVLKLPSNYMVCILQDGTMGFEGIPRIAPQGATVYNLDRIYVPSSNLRKCWRHSTGKLGLSDFGSLINNIVDLGHKAFVTSAQNHNNDSNMMMLYYRALAMYFERVAQMMGTKRGEISVKGMAVRYPFSAKAVATLSNALPKNTVGIHRDMARQLQVKDGDVVLCERFPCTGFMSLRLQKIKVHDDALGRYTIRASGNSLGSQTLDFDGDVVYIASFHSPAAVLALKKEWTNPNQSCYDVIQELNQKMGAPHLNELTLQEYNLVPFAPLNCESHADLVRKATGVKSFTGPVIALAYNIMRIIENSPVSDNQKVNCAVEYFLDKVANSIFKQKHGVKALSDIVVDAICVGDVEGLVAEGFRRGTSQMICDIIKGKAAELGVLDLKAHYEKAKATGGSNIINLIVRKQNKIYFASRSVMEGLSLLEHLESPAVDIPSRLLKWTLSGKADKIITELERKNQERALESIRHQPMRELGAELCGVIDKLFDREGCASVTEESASQPDITDQVKRAFDMIKGGVVTIVKQRTRSCL